MAKKSDIYQEKGENLASKVPESIANEFRQHAKETAGQNLKTNLACAAKLWNSFPVELQNHLLLNMNQPSLLTVIREWFRQEIAEEFEQRLSPKQKDLMIAFSEKMKLQ